MLNEMMYVRRNFRYAFISIGRDLAKLIMSVRMPISHPLLFAALFRKQGIFTYKNYTLMSKCIFHSLSLMFFSMKICLGVGSRFRRFLNYIFLDRFFSTFCVTSACLVSSWGSLWGSFWGSLWGSFWHLRAKKSGRRLRYVRH